MPTVDLATPPPAPAGTLQGLPRRVALTLPELRLLAEKAGGAPLPFDVAESADRGDSPLENRLGASRTAEDAQAYAAALDTLHDPADALTRRGLLDGDQADAGIVGALGLLATPAIALDLDVAVGTVRGRAWHRQRGSAVAALSTVDGIVFELAWFESDHWAGELARMAVVPEDIELGGSAVPALVDLPYELLDAGAEALRSGRSDLLSTVVAHHSGAAPRRRRRPAGRRTVDRAGRCAGRRDPGPAAGPGRRRRGRRQRRRRAVVGAARRRVAGAAAAPRARTPTGWRYAASNPSDLASVLGPVLAEVTA